MYKPPRAFYAGCMLGVLLGGPLLIALIGGGILLFREPLSQLLAEQQAQRLKPPPLAQEAVADYAVTLTSLEGQTRPLSDFKGEALILHFWRPDCVPCLAELPSLVRLHQALVGSGVNMAAIVVGESGAREAQSMGLDLPIYVVEVVPDAYRTGATPSTFVLSAEGEVLLAHRGSARWDDAATIAYLRSLGTGVGTMGG